MQVVKHIFKSHKLKHIGLSILLVLPMLASIVSVVNNGKARAATGITNIGHIGGYDHPPLVPYNNLTVDSLGNIFVTDTQRAKVLKYSSSSVYVTEWGGTGTGNGQFDTPSALVVDSNNNIFVLDQQNDRIQKFTNSGVYVSQFAAVNVNDMAIDSSDNIFVVDNSNNRVQKFNSSGVFQSQFGSAGNNDGEFNAPSGIAIDSSDNIFVVDAGNWRVQKFNSSGVYQSQFGSSGSGNGEFNSVTRITTDAANNVYVVDAGNNRVQKFNNSGVYQMQIATASQLISPRNVAIDLSNNILVVGVDDINFLGRVVKFNSGGSFVSYFGGYDTNNGHFGLMSALTTDTLGNVYVSDQGVNRIQKFSSSGNFLTKWGSSGTGDGQFNQAAGIGTDSSNNVYVIDNNNHRIQKFDSDGGFISKWGSSGSGDGQFSGTLLGLTTDNNDNVYIADSGNNRIQKFTSSGVYVSQFGSAGSGDGQLNSPAGIATDSNNNLYVADSGNNRIQKFTSGGVFQSQFGSAGSGNGQFSGPLDVSLSPSGKIYVADTNNTRIQKFTSGGVYQSQYAEPAGIIDFPFYTGSLKAMTNGRIYAGDFYDFRVEILCDNDESSDSCASTSGESGVTVPNAVNGKSINIDQNNCSPASSVSAVKSSSLNKLDASYNYPVGLVNFTFTGCTVGGSTTVNVKFAGVTNTNELKLRKYNSSTQTYTDVPNVSLSSTTLGGESAVLASYTITDGGPLDADATANGTIVDPVGLATSKTLAATGAVAVATTILLGIIIGSLSYTYYDYRKHKKPLMAADPYIHYTYVHHIKVVSIPLLKYRLQFQLQKVERGSDMVHKF